MKFAASLLVLTFFPLIAQESEGPRHLLGVRGPLTPASSALPESIARGHLESVAVDLSLNPADLDSVYVARQYRTEHNGVSHFVFRQRFQGADVLNAEWVVNIDRDGSVLNAGGQLFSAPKAGSVPAMRRALVAVRSAVKAVNPTLGDFPPFESAQPPRGSNKIRFAAGPLPRDVEGAPVWYSVRGKLHPAWNFFVAHTDRVHRYSVTVDDDANHSEPAAADVLPISSAAPRNGLRAGEPATQSGARNPRGAASTAGVPDFAIFQGRYGGVPDRLDGWHADGRK